MTNQSRTLADLLITSIATPSSWSRAWMRGPAINCASKKAFRGMNRLTLTLTAARNGWSGNRWGTEAQWTKKGFPVPRGTVSTRVLSMVEAAPEDTVCLHYGVKRINMVRPHDEFAAIQVGDDDSWVQRPADLNGVARLVAGAFGNVVSMSVPDMGTVKATENATAEERWSSHFVRAALRLTIETKLLGFLPDEMSSPDIIGLAVEIGTAFVLNDYGMIPDRLRDQPTVRRWSAMLVGNPEVAAFAAGLAQHAIDAMKAAGSEVEATSNRKAA